MYVIKTSPSNAHKNVWDCSLLEVTAGEYLPTSMAVFMATPGP